MPGSRDVRSHPVTAAMTAALAAVMTILLAACVRLPPDVAEAMSVASDGNHYARTTVSCVTRQADAGRGGAKCERADAR